MIRHPFSIDGQLTVNRRLTGGKLVWVEDRWGGGCVVASTMRAKKARRYRWRLGRARHVGKLLNFVLFVQLDVELDTVEQQALD